VTAVQFRTFEARRYQDPAPSAQIRIDHNSNIANCSLDGEKLRIDFAYTTSYGPIGVIKVEGTLVFQDAKAADAFEAWGKTRNLPPDIAQTVHSAIMASAVPQAVSLAKDLRLPPPIPLPQVQIQGKGKAPAPSADKGWSPEIG
jgi:hypothetical protein